MKLIQIVIPLDAPADFILEAGIHQEEAIGLAAAAAEERTFWDNGFPASFPTSFILARTKQEPLGEIRINLLKEVSQTLVAFVLVTGVSWAAGLSVV